MNKLVLYRKAKRMRQWDLANRLGISEVRLSRWECGRIPIPREAAEAIAGILEVPCMEIFPELFQQGRKKCSQKE